MNKIPSDVVLNLVTENILNSPYMVYVIVDREGIITYMNQTYLDLLEKPKEEVVGHHITEITPHTKLPEILVTGEVHEVDTWTINGRDTIITRTPIIKDGVITGAIGRSIFLDMSSAKMLVHKLQETEKELKLLQRRVPANIPRQLAVFRTDRRERPLLSCSNPWPSSFPIPAPPY